MPSAKISAYLLLGAAGSGRRELLADLLETALAADGRAILAVAETETADPADAALAALAGLTVVRWRLADGTIVMPDFAADGPVFVLADGRANPVDQVEAFKPWVESIGGELGRILCVVNCRLAEQHARLVAWYEACIHFADVVLLAKREGVANKWLSDFEARFKDKFYPCLFESLKHGRVKNPALVLDPQPRRMSHYFDEPDWEAAAEDEDDGEEGEVELQPAEDIYLERRAGGRRVKEIPSIAEFLEPRADAAAE